MNGKKWLSRSAWIGFCLILVLSLAVSLLLLLRSVFSEPLFIAQVSAQQARSQRIVKNALILSAHPSEDERAASISQLQRILPMWERVQNGLLSGDRDISLPRHPPDTIILAVRQSQPSFSAIDTAAHIILSSRDEQTLHTETTIILNQENDYDQKTSILVTLEQQWVDDSFVHIAWIEIGMVATHFTTACLLHFGVTRKSFKAIILQESTITALHEQIAQLQHPQEENNASS